MRKIFNYFIFILSLFSIFSCSTIGKIMSSNSSEGCASTVVGDNKKIVCGGSKDRVLEKLGQPDSISPTYSQWRYGLCVIEFKNNLLQNYGGKCDLKKISNDSFAGDRIEIENNKIYESKTFIDTKEIKKTRISLKLKMEILFPQCFL
jgi:hypothetical protein